MSEETLVAFLLDRSGSMEDIRQDVIGGFNAFLKEQKRLPGKCRFVFTQFDTVGIDRVDNSSIKEVRELDRDSFVPRGGTPLYDAIGDTIKHVDDLGVEADRILFVIHTDGYENASRRYTKQDIRRMIEEHQGQQNWDFVYLGSGLDAMAEGAAIGIPLGHTYAANADWGGTQAVYAAMAQSTTNTRSGASVSHNTTLGQDDRDNA